jgi:hypothetical protein
MMLKLFFNILCVFQILVFFSPDALAVTEKHSLESLSFMCGNWRGTNENKTTTVDEHWSKPDGATMIGCYRAIKGNETKFYELLVIKEQADGLVLKMKHFDKDLVGWESKEESENCRLISCSSHEAVFEGGSDGESTKITYRKTGDKTMTVLVNVTDLKTQATKALRFDLTKN